MTSATRRTSQKTVGRRGALDFWLRSNKTSPTNISERRNSTLTLKLWPSDSTLRMVKGSELVDLAVKGGELVLSPALVSKSNP